MGQSERGRRFDEVQPRTSSGKMEAVTAPASERPSERAKTLSPAARDRVVSKQALLSEAADRLGVSLDLRITTRTLVDLVVPALGDEAVVDLIESDGRMRRFVATSDFVSEDPNPVEGNDDHEEVLSSGRTSILPGALHAPLEANGRTIGLLSVFSSAERRWSDAERSIVEELARRGAIAIDHAMQMESLRLAVKRRDEAIALVAHDLRTPLQTMQINAMRLLRELDGAPHASRKLADELRRTAERLRHHVQSVLDLETIDAGRVRLQKRHHDPAELIGEALETLRPIAAEKGQKLDAAVHHHRAVPCDRDRFVQVLTSIVGSAIRLAPVSAVLDVAVHAVGRDAVFRVRDGGAFPVDDLDRIFDRDWRGPSREPFGLTLAVAKGIVEAHGGRAWVERDDACAVVCFTVPIGESTRPPAP